MGHVLSARLLLGILVVTATTGGFILGYFVGKSTTASPSGSSAVGQQLNEGGSVPLIPAPRPNPAGQRPSAAVSSVLQTPSPENKQYDTAPPPPEKSAARTDTKDSGKASPTGGRAPSAPEVKASSAERGSAGLTTVSRTVGPGDQAAPKSSPPEGAKDVSGSAGSSSGKVVYTVQAGAFRSQKDAEALKRKLEAKKYKALIKKEADAKGVFFFKVRSGEFENRKEASVFALKLKKTDGLDAFAVEKK